MNKCPTCDGMLYADEEGIICVSCGRYHDYFIMTGERIISTTFGRRVTYGDVQSAAKHILFGVPASLVSSRIGISQGQLHELMKYVAEKAESDSKWVNHTPHITWFTKNQKNRGGKFI